MDRSIKTSYFILALLLLPFIALGAPRVERFDVMTSNDPLATSIESQKDLEFTSTGGIKVPEGTTAQRPLTCDAWFRYNTELGTFEGCTSEDGWGPIAGGGGGLSQWEPDEDYIEDISTVWYDDGTRKKIYVANTTHTSTEPFNSALWDELGDGINRMGAVSDNRLVKTSGTSGDQLEQTGISVDDSNNMSGVQDLSSNNLTAATSGKFGNITIQGSDMVDTESIGDANMGATPAGNGQFVTTRLKANSVQLGTSQEVNEISTDGTFASDSDSIIPTQKAAKTYIDALIASSVAAGIADRVIGPGPTTVDGQVMVFNGTGGYTAKGTPVGIDSSGNITGVADLTASGIISNGSLQLDSNTIVSNDHVDLIPANNRRARYLDNNLEWNVIGTNNPELGNRMIYPSFEEALPPSGAACENCLVYRSNDAALPADIPVIHGNWLLDIDYSTSGYFNYDLADASYDGTPIAISCWARSDAGAWFILRRNGVDDDSMKYQITDQWRLYEFAVTGSSTSNGFKVQSDAGHVYLDDCSIGTQVRATAFGKLQYSNAIEIDLATSPLAGDFTSGVILVVRQGNIVTINNKTTLNYTTSTSASSDPNFLPLWAKPSVNTGLNVYSNGSSAIFRSQVTNNGEIVVYTSNYSGAGTSVSASGFGITYPMDDGLDGISYVVNTQNPDAPQIGEITFTSSACPAGTLEFGQTVSRTTYADLYSVIGNMFGQGDGSTTFNLPPKGYGIRVAALGSTADPDRASRVACATGGNTGDTVGSCQNDAFQGHRHNSGTPQRVTGSGNGVAGGGTYPRTDISFDEGTINAGFGTPNISTETRMKNIAFRGCIRYRTATVLAQLTPTVVKLGGAAGGTQSIPASTDTTIDIGSILFESGGGVSVNLSTNQVTIDQAGIYQICLSSNLEGSDAFTGRRAYIQVDASSAGTYLIGRGNSDGPGGYPIFFIAGCEIIKFSQGDSFLFEVNHNTGASRSLSSFKASLNRL